ncbi:MAG: hypothetical protein CVV37_04815 [Nitrospira bacterium HGW-Nitrospira-1]|nr:MAG: hypothetical protein CVV37_04815 [Nitrospira bacterium HGW-Nitrospira-1]
MRLRDKCIDLLYKAATGSRRGRNILTPVGALVFFCLIALVLLASYWLDNLLKLPTIIPRPYNLALSVPFLFAGVVLALWCNLLFLKAKGTPVPLNPPKSLIVTGPYAITRNPMLTGSFSGLFGIGVLMNSFFLMFVFTPLLVLLAVLELKYIEEPELEKRFGQSYIAYRKSVPMVFPSLKRKNMK